MADIKTGSCPRVTGLSPSFVGRKAGAGPSWPRKAALLPPRSHPPAGELEAAALEAGPPVAVTSLLRLATEAWASSVRTAGRVAGGQQRCAGPDPAACGEPQEEPQGQARGRWAQLPDLRTRSPGGSQVQGRQGGRLLLWGGLLRVADCIQTLTRTLGCQSRRGLEAAPHSVSTKAPGGPRRVSAWSCSLSLVSQRSCLWPLRSQKLPLKE